LLASLEEKSTCGELNYFLRVEDKELNTLKDDYLVDEAVGKIFILFWESMILLAEDASSCF